MCKPTFLEDYLYRETCSNMFKYSTVYLPIIATDLAIVANDLGWDQRRWKTPIDSFPLLHQTFNKSVASAVRIILSQEELLSNQSRKTVVPC